MPDERVRAVSYAVRPRAVIKYLGELGVVLALTALPLPAVALAAREWHLVLPFAAAAAGAGALGALLRRVPAPAALQMNEALVVTALAFVLAPLAMAGPFLACGLRPLDAFFEAVSAVTTTGLSTLSSVEGRPRTFLFARAWMQWYGGLGFVVLSLALLVGPGVAARRLGAAAAEGDDPAESARAHARRLLGIYCALTAVGVGALALLGAAPFEALLYTLAGVSTGGFAPHDASVAAVGSWPLRAAVLVVSLSGAVALPLYRRARREGLRRFAADAELRALLGLCLAAGAALAFLHALEAGALSASALGDALLLGGFAQTTTGFSTVAPGGLDAASKAVLILAMASGGSLASTAGGIKLMRLLVAFQVLRWLLLRARLPAHAVSAPRLGGERLEADEVQRALAVMAVFAATIFFSWLPFLVLGYNPLDALFEVTSAVGTVGLSAGITRPDLEPVLKAVLCADMLFGRLEGVAFLVLLAPRTWLGRRTD